MNVSLFVLIVVPIGMFLLGMILGTKHTNDLIKISVQAGFETCQRNVSKQMAQALGAHSVQEEEEGEPSKTTPTTDKVPMGFDLTPRK